MKRNTILVGLAALVMAAATANAQRVEYGGRDLRLNPTPIREGSTWLLPVRDTSNKIGARIDHNGRDARITWRNNTATFRTGDDQYVLNGRRYDMRTRSFERRDVLYMPAEFFEQLTNNDLRVIAADWRNRDEWDRPRDDRANNPRYPRGDQNNDRFGERVYFNGREIRFDRGEEPFTSGRTLLVPARAMASATGTRMERTEDGKRIILRYGRNEVVYDRGRTNYRINRQERSLPSAARDRGDIYFVPIEIFDAVTDGRVTWGGNRR